MVTWIKRMLSGPTPEERAARELDMARKALLEAQSAEEFARSQVEYNKTRITRIRNWLSEQTAENHEVPNVRSVDGSKGNSDAPRRKQAPKV